MVLDFILIVGGEAIGRTLLKTVTVASPDPVGQPVPDCKKVLGNFPEGIYGSVGTSIGELKGDEKSRVSLV